MNRPQLVHVLRTAWSMGWGGVTVLMAGLWVRSYWYLNNLSCDQPLIGIALLHGRILLNHHFQQIISTGEINSADYIVFGYRLTYQSCLLARAERDIRGHEIPLWFATTFVALLASIPWFRWRFSVRTLLIAITLVAVVLGLVVYLNRAPAVPPINVGDFGR